MLKFDPTNGTLEEFDNTRGNKDFYEIIGCDGLESTRRYIGEKLYDFIVDGTGAMDDSQLSISVVAACNPFSPLHGPAIIARRNNIDFIGLRDEDIHYIKANSKIIKHDELFILVLLDNENVNECVDDNEMD